MRSDLPPPPGDAPALPPRAILPESRVFRSPSEFTRHAPIHSLEELDDLAGRGERDAEGFWKEAAKVIDWLVPFRAVYRTDPGGEPAWFVGGRTNASYNCLDRHLLGWRRNKAALIWEGAGREERVLTYHGLHREVGRCAAALRRLGVAAGARVAIVLPGIPELPIALLACTRIGAVPLVLAPELDPAALRSRLSALPPQVVVTADGARSDEAERSLKETVDEAVEDVAATQVVLVVRHRGKRVRWLPERDRWWHEALAEELAESAPPEPLDADHPLVAHVSSGVNRPARAVVHPTGGFLVQASLTARWVLDMKEEDTHWCAAPLSSITGLAYGLFGILVNGGTALLTERARAEPEAFWGTVQRHRVTTLLAAADAFEHLRRRDADRPRRANLSSLRLLVTTGDVLSASLWMWLYKTVGGGRCPVVDGWLQAEAGVFLLAPLPGPTPMRPGAVVRALPGIVAGIVDARGEPVPAGHAGALIIRRPWPARGRVIPGDAPTPAGEGWDDESFVYRTGDWAACDEDGNVWILGRQDTVVPVEDGVIAVRHVQAVLTEHPDVDEAAVVMVAGERAEREAHAFLSLRPGARWEAELIEDLRARLRLEVGLSARAGALHHLPSLPRTAWGAVDLGALRGLAAPARGGGGAPA